MVNCVRFSPDGNRSLTVGGDKKGYFYDGKTGEKLGEIEPVHKLGIYSCSWSPDSQHFATASADKACRIFNAEGKCSASVELGKDVTDQQLGCLWVNDTVLSFGLGGDYHYIRPDGSRVRTVYGHNKFITALTYDPERRRLISASFDGKLVLWDVASGESAILDGKGHGTAVIGMGVAGNQLISVSSDDTVMTSDLAAGNYGPTAGLDTTPTGCAVGKSLAVVVTKKSVNVVVGGKVVSTVACPWEPTCVAVNPAENMVAVGGADKAVHMYALAGNSLTERGKLERHRGPITAVSFAPDGKLASADSVAREVMVWVDGECKTDGWVYHTAKVNAIAWAPDSIHLATAGLDSACYVWNFAEQGKRIHIPNAHPGGVNSVIFIGGDVFASAGQDAAIKTWALTY
jgi:WD40 repeat protein